MLPEPFTLTGIIVSATFLLWLLVSVFMTSAILYIMYKAGK